MKIFILFIFTVAVCEFEILRNNFLLNGTITSIELKLKEDFFDHMYVKVDFTFGNGALYELIIKDGVIFVKEALQNFTDVNLKELCRNQLLEIKFQKIFYNFNVSIKCYNNVLYQIVVDDTKEAKRRDNPNNVMSARLTVFFDCFKNWNTYLYSIKIHDIIPNESYKKCEEDTTKSSRGITDTTKTFYFITFKAILFQNTTNSFNASNTFAPEISQSILIVLAIVICVVIAAIVIYVVKAVIVRWLCQKHRSYYTVATSVETNETQLETRLILPANETRSTSSWVEENPDNSNPNSHDLINVIIGGQSKDLD